MVYAGTVDGYLYALRASDGSVLWTYTTLFPAEPLSPAVADGIAYLTLQFGGLDVLRANTGILLWQFSSAHLLPLPLITHGVVYALRQDGYLYALRASDGFILWRHHSGAGGQASITIAPGEIYLAFSTTSSANTIASITALRASDGFVLWHYTPHVFVRQLSPVGGDDLVLITLQDGSIDALRANNGALRWHRAMNS
jgi:outer membrane protein assembly factor BamB